MGELKVETGASRSTRKAGAEETNMPTPTEWSGHPDPRDRDDYWIDDKTGERVSAKTGERTATTFAGFHQFANVGGNESSGPIVKNGSFEVFHTQNSQTIGGEKCEPGWYWWPCFPGCMPDDDPSGPFETAEGAYLDAIGE